MTQIPEVLIFQARRLLNDDGFYSDADMERQLKERRDAAIKAIEWYKELKKAIVNRDKMRKEITEWFKENNISLHIPV